ncbi:MAG TPA: Ig-like domain-containing protein, partial [Polyangia bacterium]
MAMVRIFFMVSSRVVGWQRRSSHPPRPIRAATIPDSCPDREGATVEGRGWREIDGQGNIGRSKRAYSRSQKETVAMMNALKTRAIAVHSLARACAALSVVASLAFAVGCGGSGSATLTSIAVTPANPSIAKGSKQQFVATGTYSDKTTKDLSQTVTWASETAATATISSAVGSKGVATGVATGTSVITATSGSVSGKTTLTVSSAALVSIAVTPAMPSIAKGSTQQFVATGTYDDATTQNVTSMVTWASATLATATISDAATSKGLATAVAAGTTVISATSGAITGGTTLTVTGATLTSIAVTPATPSIAKGSTQQFVATGTYNDATTQDLSATVTWAS